MVDSCLAYVFAAPSHSVARCYTDDWALLVWVKYKGAHFYEPACKRERERERERERRPWRKGTDRMRCVEATLFGKESDQYSAHMYKSVLPTLNIQP